MIFFLVCFYPPISVYGGSFKPQSFAVFGAAGTRTYLSLCYVDTILTLD